MNRLPLLLAGVALLGLAACDHPDAERQRETHAVKAVSKLDCPERQGQLKRSTAASDGLSCVYTGDGAEVTLKLVALDGGSVNSALAPIEAELKALLPGADVAPPPPSADGVDIRLPGVSIQAGEQGAKIRAPGVEVNAVENGCAEVRAMRDKSDDKDGKGDGGAGVSGRYILACETSTTDWRAVGYDARGPVGGPLVVGVVRAKARDGGHDGLFDDTGDLVRHNVGGRERRAEIRVD